jgi:hypothetical protein
MLGVRVANRGQTAVIGNLLLVAVGLVLVTVVAVVGIGIAEDVDTEAPAVDIQTLVEESDVFVRHGSGDVLESTDIEVVLKPPGANYRVPLENFRSLSAGQFRSGDSGRLAHGVASGEITVLVVHEPSNTIIDRTKRRLTDGRISLASFDAAIADSTNNYAGNQNGDGTTTVEDGGRTVRLTGNQWKFIHYQYDVSRDTVLTFEFKSTAEGDIHGIGLEDNTGGQDDKRIVQVYGTQKWGINVSKHTSEPYYQQSDNWRRYTIPLGELYDARNRLGQASSLVVVMDCDPNGPSQPRSGCKSQTADGKPTATAYFRNIEVYEAD